MPSPPRSLEPGLNEAGDIRHDHHFCDGCKESARRERALLERLEEVERDAETGRAGCDRLNAEKWHEVEARDRWRSRAESAEARVASLEEALRDIEAIDSAPRDSMHSRLLIYQQRGQAMLDAARKALAQGAAAPQENAWLGHVEGCEFTTDTGWLCEPSCTAGTPKRTPLPGDTEEEGER